MTPEKGRRCSAHLEASSCLMAKGVPTYRGGEDQDLVASEEVCTRPVRLVRVQCFRKGQGPRLPSYGVNISQLVRFARLGVALPFRISIIKLFNLLPNYLCRVPDITSFEKHSESSSGHTLTCCLNLVKYSFKNMLRKESFTRSSTVI